MPISFTLVSDTILHNEFGYCATDVNTLKKYLGKGVKVLKAFAKAGQVESFVGKWGLKKPLETCFLAGSCFLLDISNAELSQLNELNKFGIGEKTNEGFGKCIFALQTTDELTELNIDNDYYELDEPEVPVPDKTKEIIKILIQNYIIKQSSSMAFSDQYRFKNLPTKSFINKLESIAKKGNSFEFKDNIKELLKRDFSKNNCNYVKIIMKPY
ncbi:MAG: hypothetical protein OMM_04680 [Candidatus Magnetoglobus multicellularis str. Araruama]|uniref:Uncharacterized protein n=1 Tax=Candidatus Magnetoglobus multicellularis str. Araruama TaxID=890399 RepID=A0A1V1P039_9BACT|nr:MAG: hypothetical protein OMM_04680 [Candidatus Magnetoglobus multicellularis str. Araruama]